MKKIKYMIIMLLTFVMGSSMVFAEEVYDNVNIVATFAEDVDITKISLIKFNLEDFYGNESDLILESSKNFTLDVKNIQKGTIEVPMVLVENDTHARLLTVPRITYDGNNVFIVLEVSNNPIEPNEKPNISDDIKDKIYNNDEDEDPKFDSSYGTGDEEPDYHPTTKVTTTNKAGQTDEEVKEELKKEEEEEKKTARKRQNTIVKVVLIIAGVSLVIGGGYVAVKISNANK